MQDDRDDVEAAPQESEEELYSSMEEESEDEWDDDLGTSPAVPSKYARDSSKTGAVKSKRAVRKTAMAAVLIDDGAHLNSMQYSFDCICCTSYIVRQTVVEVTKQ